MSGGSFKLTKRPKECQWCDGSGTDKEFSAIGGIRACWDCEGTGFERGLKAKEKYEEDFLAKMKREEKRLGL